MVRGTLRIGTSGYQYDHWRGPLFPAGLAKSKWFAYYAERFDTVEINNTFYRLPSRRIVDHWCRQAPAGFLYALKYSRYGTHLKHLKDPDTHIDRFTALAQMLGTALGPILVQLPPRWRVKLARLAAFLDRAPREHLWAFEFRDRSWFDDSVYALLQEHNAAMCLHDMFDDHPREMTADWTYLRYHGPAGDHGGSYSHQRLAAHARRISTLLDEGRDVYVYFNNDAKGYAVQNACALKRYLVGRSGCGS